MSTSMKFRYLPFLLSIAVLFGNGASAQLVGDNAFMQGQWLEVAIAPNGSWGNSVNVPAGYHTRGSASTSYTDPGTGTTPTGNGMDFSFDQGHDGWTVGTVPWVGSYYLPGTPFDGWSVQIDDTMGSAFYTDAGYNTSEGGIFSGTVDKYIGPSCIDPHAAMAGIFHGTYGLKRAGLNTAMQIEQVNEVDTFASWLNVTTKFRNTTDSTLKGVYYFASADPDNDVSIGGTYSTHNHIAYQGGPLNEHEVWARPPSTHQDAFSGLATQDCRAKVLIYSSWPPSMTPGNNLDLVYAGTPTAMGSTYYTLGATTLADIAYAVVFNIGNIAPHDSAVITYAWIFSDTTVVDSLFGLSPKFSAEGKVITNGHSDTVLQCTMSGCNITSDTTFIATVLNGENRNWGLSTWTWSPAIGLSSTLGTSPTINFKKLAGPVTYTITGTPFARFGNCNPSPAPVTFYLYAQPCFSASSNIPCEGDTLFLIGTGDTTGATFAWSGPGGYTGTGESTFRFPIALGDTGIYRLIKTVGSYPDTVYTHVAKIKPLPKVVAGSNSPICSGGTLSLKATSIDPLETYLWKGPNTFASVLQNPPRLAVTVSDSGKYWVYTQLNGCNDSGYTDVVVDSTPAVPKLSSFSSPVCSQHPITLTANDVTPGVSYSWSGPNSFTSTLKSPFIASENMQLPAGATASFGTYKVVVKLTDASGHYCLDSNTLVVEVDSTPVLPVLTTNAPVCSGTPLSMTATSLAGSTYNWSGPIGFTSTTQNPTIPYSITANTGIYSVTATYVYPAISCTSAVASIYSEVDSTALIPNATSNSPGFPGVSICQGDTLKLYSSDSTHGVSYTWIGANSFGSTQQNPYIVNVLPAATGSYTVQATLGFGCISQAIITVSITPTPPLTATSNSPVCSGNLDSLFLQAVSGPGAAFSWTGPYNFSSNLSNPSRSPVLTEYDGIYTVTALLDGCYATINDTVVINETPPAPWTKWLTFCQYYLPDPLQAAGSNILWYPSSLPPLKGSPVAPIPNTNIVAETFYYATQTVKGCISAMDSMKVTVYRSPKVTVSPDVSICPRDTATITAKDTDQIAYYNWSPSIYLSDTNASSILIRPETNVRYTVVVTNMFGCTDTAQVNVTVKAGAVLSLPDSAIIYPGETYQLSPQTNCEAFRWTPSEGLSSAYISNPVASPLVNTKYIVTGVSSSGCRTSDSIDIYVSTESLLAVPNAFSPGNGPNGLFKIIKRGIATLKNFTIYDRWGVKVFETSDIDAGWDGTFNGTPQPFGVYVYEINAVTSAGTTFIKHGNVTLVR